MQPGDPSLCLGSCWGASLRLTLTEMVLPGHCTRHTVACIACTLGEIHSPWILKCSAMLHSLATCSVTATVAPVCMQALTQVQLARRAFAGVGAGALLALVAFLGRGSAPLTAGPILSLAAAALSVAAFAQLQKLEAQFVFTDWVNHEK